MDNVPANNKEQVDNSVYYALASFMNEVMKNDVSLQNIDFSKSSMKNAANILSYVRNGMCGGKFTETYGNYKVTFNTVNMWSSFAGSVTITPVNGKGSKYTGTITSTIEGTKQMTKDYLDELSDVVKAAGKVAIFSILTGFADVTCISECTNKELQDFMLDKVQDLQDKGYRDVLAVFVNFQDGYKAIKPVITATKGSRLQTVLKEPKKIYDALENMDFSKQGVRKKAVRQSLDALQNAKDILTTKLYNKIYDTNLECKEYKNEIGNNKKYKKMEYKCPVDLEVYNEENQLIGYVDSTDKQEDSVFYSDGIYIEIEDDVKRVYVPDNKTVVVKVIATGNGQMTCTIEQAKTTDGEEDEIAGRLNYYNVPLTVGKTYTQNIAGSIDLSSAKENLPLKSDSETINADEYLDASNDSRYVTITSKTLGNGIVIGDGKYAKGDSVVLHALVSDDSYTFSGWYIDGELVSSNKDYRFTAINDLNVKAEFEKKILRNTNFQIALSKDYEASFVDLYKAADEIDNIMIRVQSVEDSKVINSVTINGYSEENILIFSNDYVPEKDGDNNFWINGISVKNCAKIELSDANKKLISTCSRKSSSGGNNASDNQTSNGGNRLPDTVREKIKIKSASQKVAAGKKTKLIVRTASKTLSSNKVTWKSSNKKYAVVNTNGVVTTKKAGAGKIVTITVISKADSSVKATIKIRIMKNAVTKIKIKNPPKSMKVGKSIRIKAVVNANGSNANKRLQWKSSNSKYASVDSNGKVVAKKAGKGRTVTITASATDGTGKTAKIKIKIK